MVTKEEEAAAESFTEASFCSFSSSLSTCKACEALGRPGGRHMYTPESFTCFKRYNKDSRTDQLSIHVDIRH